MPAKQSTKPKTSSDKATVENLQDKLRELLNDLIEVLVTLRRNESGQLSPGLVLAVAGIEREFYLHAINFALGPTPTAKLKTEDLRAAIDAASEALRLLRAVVDQDTFVAAAVALRTLIALLDRMR